MSKTIRDVARAAGVSISTVSRVLNDTCPVSEDKRRLVFEAAQALNYRPNPAARSLLNKKTGGIGVLLPFVSGEFFSEFLGGLDVEAQDNEFFLMISTSHRNQDEFQMALRAMANRVDGLIVMAPGLDSLEAIPNGDRPVVFVNTDIDGRPFDAINFDNFGGSYSVTRHLLELGHQRIAIIKGPAYALDARERMRGYRTAMLEANLWNNGSLEYEGGFDQEAGHAATMEILRSGPNPTAIIAANDYCAIGVLSALHDEGIKVPDEIAVAGFDGIDSAQYTLPPLTTVHVPVREIGSMAIKRLISRMEGRLDDEAQWRHVVPVELIVRESTVTRSG